MEENEETHYQNYEEKKTSLPLQISVYAYSCENMLCSHNTHTYDVR